MTESLEVIGESMRSHERGATAMYIAMAAQLRILFCDTQRKKDHSLLGRLLPDLRLLAFRAIEVQGPGPLRFAFPPLEITRTATGIVLADFDLSHPPRYIPLAEWREQVVTLEPCRLTANQIIRTVCDKGGGAHVDDDDGLDLSAMKRGGPTEGGIHIAFTIAMARYALHFGDPLLKEHGKRWGIDEWRFRPPVQVPRRHWQWEIVEEKSRD